MPEVVWYKHGYQLQNSIDFQITTTDNTSKLVIREAYISDSGDYQVKIFNEIGDEQTKSQLEVLSSKFY